MGIVRSFESKLSERMISETCDNWADQPPEYNDKAHNSVGSFWSKSGVILLSLVITFITATIIASTLDNCKSSKELGSIVICDEAGSFLALISLYILLFMVLLSFFIKYAVNFIRLYPALRCPSDGERCGFN